MQIQEVCTDIGIGMPMTTVDFGGEDDGEPLGLYKERVTMSIQHCDWIQRMRALEARERGAAWMGYGAMPGAFYNSSYPSYDPTSPEASPASLYQTALYPPSQPSSALPQQRSLSIRRPAGSAKHRNRMRLLRLASAAREQPDHKPTTPSPLRNTTSTDSPSSTTSSRASTSSVSSSDTLVSVSTALDTDSFLGRIRSWSLDIPRPAAQTRPDRKRTISTDTSLSGATLIWQTDDSGDVGVGIKGKGKGAESETRSLKDEGKRKTVKQKVSFKGLKKTMQKVWKGVAGEWEGRENNFSKV
ncbi:hypothetical protein HDV00_007804 [Rhizophlyctis rosea]|nr:hypothetical protein HDV00_007804 [Rhizophlyctis rosea]